jgi:hypothetical protein
MQYFNNKPKDNSKRYGAVNTVRVWLEGRAHLPKDLVRALHELIPELGNGAEEDDPTP